jgi:hypothetical protein
MRAGFAENSFLLMAVCLFRDPQHPPLLEITPGAAKRNWRSNRKLLKTRLLHRLVNARDFDNWRELGR